MGIILIAELGVFEQRLELAHREISSHRVRVVSGLADELKHGSRFLALGEFRSDCCDEQGSRCEAICENTRQFRVSVGDWHARMRLLLLFVRIDSTEDLLDGLDRKI